MISKCTAMPPKEVGVKEAYACTLLLFPTHLSPHGTDTSKLVESTVVKTIADETRVHTGVDSPVPSS